MTVAGSHGAWLLSQAAGMGSAAWLLLAALWERRLPLRERSPYGGAAPRMPRFVGLAAAAMLGVCGFPALGRMTADLVVGWTLAQQHPWGLAAALFGWLMIGWSALRWLERWCSGLPGERDAAAVSFRADLHDVSWREALVLAPVLAWCVWSLIAPAPIDS
jgi:NADH:ubiquinone oxidoreductase subunit 4 (subunit M)